MGVFSHLMYLFPYKIKADHLHNDREQPGTRIRNKQHIQRTIMRKDSKNPYHSHTYGTDNRKDHRYGRIAHASECSRKQIHDTAPKKYGTVVIDKISIPQRITFSSSV